jgi:hypothetical protein
MGITQESLLNQLEKVKPWHGKGLRETSSFYIEGV